MQDNEKFPDIFVIIKKTFDSLRGMLPDTPSEPAGFWLPQDQRGQIQGSETPHGKAAIVTEVKSEIEEFKIIPDCKITLFSQEHRLYLENVIATFEYMRLPGFQVGELPLKVPFEKAFIAPTFLDKRIGSIHPERDNGFYGGAGALSISSALQRYRRLVITGGPGSGKTSLLVNLLLMYARNLLGERPDAIPGPSSQDGSRPLPAIKQRLHVAEYDYLPIYISLRDLGRFLQERHPRSGKDESLRLLTYMRITPAGTGGSFPDLPEKFFNLHLQSGKALILMDGLDEVENPVLFKRVAALIEKFVKRFPACRYIVTSRPTDCGSTAFFGDLFGTLQICEFNPVTAREFARAWSRTLESSLAGGETPDGLKNQARQSADELIQALVASQRTSELATSPLALFLLILIQHSGRYTGRPLPERRIDLYEAALEVLLERNGSDKRSGKRKLERPEKRRTLEMIAFWLQQHNKNEITRDELSAILQTWFLPLRNGDATLADIEIETFLQDMVEQDNGLFVEQRVGLFRFTHRTFQEVLAAQALADRDDTLAYTRKCLSIPWWRDVILFEAGLLGRQAKHRVSELIRFIVDEGAKSAMKPYFSSFLAAECLLDLDPKHLEIGLLIDVRNGLQKLVSAPTREGDRQGFMEKVSASNSLVSLQGGQTLARFWKAKYGEPEWVKIPSGEFWMGEVTPDSAHLAHLIYLPEYAIARVPVTNAQYAIYLKDTGNAAPINWHNGQTPRGRENHPVVNVNWYEALSYCEWLGGKINKPVNLPSEAEWEKAARGAQDQRDYPWGAWDELRANTSDLLLGDTTPVGLFPNGASPYGVLDMTGNVREWTRSLSGYGYPYDPTDKVRENLLAPKDQPRVLRGGSFYCTRDSARCSDRQRYYPDFGFYNFGFRVVISPASAPVTYAAPPQ